jgi:putative resolvase
LADWARAQGISYTTAWRWVKDDAMPVPWHQARSGTIPVDVVPAQQPRAVALYARVCSRDRRSDLDRQLVRLSQYAERRRRRSIVRSRLTLKTKRRYWRVPLEAIRDARDS